MKRLVEIDIVGSVDRKAMTVGLPARYSGPGLQAEAALLNTDDPATRRALLRTYRVFIMRPTAETERAWADAPTHGADRTQGVPLYQPRTIRQSNTRPPRGNASAQDRGSRSRLSRRRRAGA